MQAVAQFARPPHEIVASTRGAAFGTGVTHLELTLTKREASLVLAALRNWQEETKTVDLADYFEAYFEEHEPLNAAEIDALCARITDSAMRSAE
jgi:hypothetical protein